MIPTLEDYRHIQKENPTWLGAQAHNMLAIIDDKEKEINRLTELALNLARRHEWSKHGLGNCQCPWHVEVRKLQ